MSFTFGTNKVLLHIQTLIPLPYYVDPKTHQLTESPFYSQPKFRYFRLFSLSLILFIYFPITTCRLLWLFFHWNSYTILNFQEAIIYFIIWCLIVTILPAIHTNLSKNEEFMYLVNQTVQLNRLSKYASLLESKLNRHSSSPEEILIYFMSLCFFQLIPAFVVIPLFLPYLHLQIIFGSSVIVKVCEAFLAGIAITFGSFTDLPVLLYSMTVVENLNNFSSKMFTKFNVRSFFRPMLRFSNCYKKFQCCQIVLQLGNIVYGSYLLVLILVGILLASCYAYATIRMFGNFNLIIYIIFPAMLCVCLFIALLLTILGSTPFKHNKNFKMFWMRQLLRKEDKKRLRACHLIGFDLGPYGLCTNGLGLHICNSIIDNAVALILFDLA